MLAMILLRVVLSVSANAVQKRLLNARAGVNHTWILTYALMLGPASIAAAIHPAAGGILFWRDILLGGGLDAIGNLAMVAALRGTDISIFGPLNALRPILALFAGWLFLSELPTKAGFTGVAITFIGAVVLFGGPKREGYSAARASLLRMLGLRLAGLALGTIGAVFLKRAAMHSSAEMTVAAWILCGLFVLLIAALARQASGLLALPQTLQAHRSWLLIHAAAFIVMQWLTIRIFQTTLLAYSFVFFQLGMVLQVIVGRVFFKEAAFRRRMAGAIIMSIGSGVIAWKG